MSPLREKYLDSQGNTFPCLPPGKDTMLLCHFLMYPAWGAEAPGLLHGRWRMHRAAHPLYLLTLPEIYR